MSQDSGKDHLDHLFGSDSERSAEEQEYESIEKDEHPMVEERTSEQSSISEDEKVARPNRKRTLADVKIKEMAIKKLSAPDVDNRMVCFLGCPFIMLHSQYC